MTTASMPAGTPQPSILAPPLSGPEAIVPSVQSSLWVLLRADDFTSLYEHEGIARGLLRESFAIDDAVNTFCYDGAVLGR